MGTEIFPGYTADVNVTDVICVVAIAIAVGLVVIIKLITDAWLLNKAQQRKHELELRLAELKARERDYPDRKAVDPPQPVPARMRFVYEDDLQGS